jgi:hypothetical protein
MLSTLIERIHSGEMVEPDGLIEYFDRGDSALELRIQLRDYEYPHVLERWRVYCAAPREFRIVPEPGLIAAFNETHSAVRQFVDGHVDLFFSGMADPPERVIEGLRQAHQRIAGHWVPFDRYLNKMSLTDLFKSGSGKIFSGPRFLAREYEPILRGAGLDVSRIPDEPPAVAHATTTLQMLQVGESYVIADDFLAELIPSPHAAAQQTVAADGASRRR